MDIPSKYQKMKTDGRSPQAVYREAHDKDGYSTIQSLVLIRQLYNYSLMEAKEVMVTAYGQYESLDAYQESLVEPLRQALEIMEREDVEEQATDTKVD